VNDSHPTAAALGGTSSPSTSVTGDVATRDRVIAATIACILDGGYYRASTNEIARKAGVTWGVIQHYFGTREGLMLAVLEEGAHRFADSLGDVRIEADDAEGRMGQLLDIFCSHYNRPEYLADLQILLNMDRDPRTSGKVRQTMRDVAERSNAHVRRLLHEALGAPAEIPDLATTVFLVMRGFGLSQQLHDTMAYDSLAPKQDRMAQQRRLLAGILAPFFEQAERDPLGGA
jgi:AcrR family transcriptional regulator